MLLALVLAAAPVVSLSQPDAGGCGTILVDGAAALGGPVGLCVRQVTWTELSGGLVAALVKAPHRYDARVRNRVFLYRLEGRRLVPRFLGAGFTELEVIRLVPRGDALALEVHGPGDDSRTHTLTCRLVRFPLVCSEEP